MVISPRTVPTHLTHVHTKLDGLDRLTANGRFAVADSSEAATNLMMDLAPPMSAFVRERCTREPGAEVKRDVLYTAWKDWAEENGHAVTAKSTFGRDLRAVVPELRDFQKRDGFQMFRYYGGIALLPASPASDGETAGQDVSSEAGYPASNGQAKPQVSDPEAGEAPKSAFKTRYNNGAKPFCPGCGYYYYAANGHHRGDCTAVVSKLLQEETDQ